MPESIGTYQPEAELDDGTTGVFVEIERQAIANKPVGVLLLSESARMPSAVIRKFALTLSAIHVTLET